MGGTIRTLSLALLVTALAGTCLAGGAAPSAVEGGVAFSFEAPGASSVHLAGEFNTWSPTSHPMSDADGDGVWDIVVELQTGRSYEYKFVVNGGESWREDPNNDYTVDDNHGGINTVVSVTDDGEVALGPLGGGEPMVHEPVVDGLPSVGRPIDVAIIWHQHQPKYLRDLQTGEYLEPWVRMHAIKDYYDMVAILEEYPDVHFTVNLTPVLLTQLQNVIDGYESGGGTDRYLRATLQDAATLGTEDQLFLLTHFFNAHWDNMIHVWPRYRELKDMKGGDSRGELEASASTFSEQDWRDLQAWFNLAWFDPDFQERDVELPDGSVVTVRHMIEKERGFTEDDKREIIEAQVAVMRNVVAVHREMRERGQLEIVTTPFYHPILPLIHDTNLARVASPSVPLPTERMSYPADAAFHVEEAASYYEQLFGARPEGMWPAEGAVAQEIVPVVAASGFRWMASDDQVLERSLGRGGLSEDQRYQMYWADEGGSRVAMIFRDHRLSDDIGFNFGKMDGVQAANSMMRSLHGIHKRFADADGRHVVPIILDGENAWEWYRHDGKEFFRSWYDQLSRAPWVRTVTVAEHLAEHEPGTTLPRLWAGSWIGHSFATWIGESEENLAWDYLARVRADMEVFRTGGEHDEEALARAFDEVYAAEGSDWFWWYGTDQDSPLEGEFDASYRGMLSNAYTILGEEPPGFLSETVLRGVGQAGAGGVMARSVDASDAALLAGPVMLDEGYLFSIEYPGAGTVHLAGGFNGWSTEATPLEDDGGGVWSVVVEIPPGTYEYKFVIDGGAVWTADEGNPETVADPYGGVNSVIVAE
ncbi:MAG: hypothetical protein ABIG03_04930 [Candidatus Eisenbacteria bacterium]